MIQFVQKPFTILFDFKHKVLLSVLTSVFVLLILTKIHGYSIPMWHDFIDHSPQSEIIAGKARSIRFDDWTCSLPSAFSQRETTPPFSKMNNLIGDQPQNMFVMMYLAPIKHFLSLFRPKTWGFFIGQDYGMSWAWWLSSLIMPYLFFLLFMGISGNRFGLSTFGALSLLFSGFFQFWSLNMAPMALYFAGIVLSLTWLLLAKAQKYIVIPSVFLVFFAAAFVFELYPPVQISLGYLAIFISAGIFYRANGFHLPSEKRMKTFALIVIFLATVGIICCFFYETRDAVKTMLQTVYPGQRLIGGGQARAILALSDNFFPRYSSHGNLYPFDNICESASSFMLMPLISFSFVLDTWKSKKADFLVTSLVSYCLVSWIWMYIGLPPWLAKLTFAGMVPENRMVFSMGIANSILIVAFLSQPQETTLYSSGKGGRRLLLFLWAIFVLFIGIHWKHTGGSLKYPTIILGTLISTIAGYLLLKRSRFLLPLLAILAMGYTATFNPIVRGGFEFLSQNSVSQMILKNDQATFNQSGKKSRWIVFNDDIVSNLPRILGIQCLNGVQYVPQLEFWKKLDPSKKFYGAYNRYAHVRFSLPEQPAEFDISAPQGDAVVVTISPDHPLFLSLDVDYILVSGDRSGFDKMKKYRFIEKVGNFSVYGRV